MKVPASLSLVFHIHKNGYVMNLNDMRTSGRLGMGFACLVVRVALMAGFGFPKVKSTDESISTIYADRVEPLKWDQWRRQLAA